MEVNEKKFELEPIFQASIYKKDNFDAKEMSVKLENFLSIVTSPLVYEVSFSAFVTATTSSKNSGYLETFRIYEVVGQTLIKGIKPVKSKLSKTNEIIFRISYRRITLLT